MDIKKTVNALVATGYPRNAARAKVAHDIVLAAIDASGMKERITIKGGVAMGGLTKAARRATLDMDMDFVRHSLRNDAIERFIKALDRNSDCGISIEGEITELRQQEYKGKRVYLRIADGNGQSVVTKVDFGVQANAAVIQRDLAFELVPDGRSVVLLANSNEQIFVEKLKSLVRFGTLSSRYKDVYDMYYLAKLTDRDLLKDYMRMYIFDDERMKEKSAGDVVSRLTSVFSDRLFFRNLGNRRFAWLDVTPETATAGILEFVASLGAGE